MLIRPMERQCVNLIMVKEKRKPMKIQIKHLIMVAVAVAMICGASVVSAAEWTDPATGIKWEYTISNASAKEVKLGTGTRLDTCIDTGTSGHLIIPATINGYSVVGILAYAFYNCTNLTGVTFPHGLRTIDAPTGEAASWSSSPRTFAYCGGITELEFPKGMVSIASGGLLGTSVHSLIIPEGMTVDLSSWFSSSELYRPSLDWLKEIYTYGDQFSIENTKLEYLYYTPKYAENWDKYLLFFEEEDQWTSKPVHFGDSMGARAKVIPSIHDAGSVITNILPVVDDLYDWGASVSLTATPNEGYVFLGWSSDVEGLSGMDATITFTMPKRDVTLVPNFFPKALIQSWIQESVNGAVESGTIVDATNLKKLVEEEVQKQAEPIKAAGVTEALANGAVQTKGN